MVRKLKTFITTGGFYELAVAAPSMKAAAELLGVKSNAFSQGFAHETDDAAIIAATMEQPGVLLRRAVGTKGRFTESADLPKLSALQGAMKQKWARTATCAHRYKEAESGEAQGGRYCGEPQGSRTLRPRGEAARARGAAGHRAI